MLRRSSLVLEGVAWNHCSFSGLTRQSRRTSLASARYAGRRAVAAHFYVRPQNMGREEFEAHLAAFSRTRAWEMCEREAPITTQELQDYEEVLGCDLPPEYVHLVTILGAGQFGFVKLLSVRPGEWGIDVHRTSAPGLPINFVPISDNGCGDYYGFAVRDGRCEPRVLYADHEAGYSLEMTEFADLYEYLQRYGFHTA